MREQKVTQKKTQKRVNFSINFDETVDPWSVEAQNDQSRTLHAVSLLIG